jgi:hypothetical protein
MLSKYCQKYTCSRTGDWGPYDLAFLNQNGVNTLLVAMGEEGVLVRTADGNWQRYGVMRATPSSMQLDLSLFAILLSLVELGILAALSFIFVPIVSFCAWLVLLARMSGTSAASSRLWAMRPVLFSLAFAALAFWTFVAAAIIGTLAGLDFALNLIKCGVVPALVIGFFITWKRLATLTTQAAKVNLTVGGVFVPLLILPMGGLPMILWQFGLIARFDDALQMGLILGLVALAFVLYISVSTAIHATFAKAKTDER